MSRIITLRLKISNAFLIKGKKLALVDAGSPNELLSLTNAIEKAGYRTQDISLVILTHAHFDHCGCAGDLQKITGAPVIIHQDDKTALSKGKNALCFPINLFGKMMMPFGSDSYNPVKPDIIIDDTFDLHSYGIDGKIVPTPGHTQGSLSVLLDNGEVIAGDLIGGGWLIGLLQSWRPRYHYLYSDFNTAKKSISQIINTRPARIFVGHGGPLDGNTVIKHFQHLHKK